MSKMRTHYLCRSCGDVQSRWMGKCPSCGAWDALEAYREAKAQAGNGSSSWSAAMAGGTQAPVLTEAKPLPALEVSEVARVPSGVSEFDRVLGGGFVPGSVVLVGGDPGIGKSTLLLQAGATLAAQNVRVLYVTSEESEAQTRLRAERLFDEGAAGDEEPAPAHSITLESLDHLYVLAETNLTRIIEQAHRVRPGVMIIDSVQMIFRSDVEAAPGSVTQLRRCALELVALAKMTGAAVVLVGHVTKEGTLAGPKLLEHLVDAVLSFEGDRHHAHRIVRGVKNRFGNTLEVGLFEMTGSGLREVRDASELLDRGGEPRPGSVVAPVMHGSRCLLVEVQALTATGFLGSAKRKTSGIDANRLAMLIAVLEKHGGLRLADQDVFVSTVGGMKIVEPAADLAICLAIAGAHYGRSLASNFAAAGEVGLGGEVRRPPRIEQRTAEAHRLGFDTLITGAARSDHAPKRGSAIDAIRIISQAIERLT